MDETHGRTIYFVDGEFVQNKNTPEPLKIREQNLASLGGSFRFTRILKKEENKLSDHALERLGHLMTVDDSDDAYESKIPSGYTYLGQFIAHEITHNGSLDLKDFPKNAADIVQLTSPSLDMASLYGSDPNRIGSPATRCQDPSLEIDETAKDESLPRLLPSRNDLHRKDGVPLIPEVRNDLNLNSAQIHVVVSKFSNAVAEYCYDGNRKPDFSEVRRVTTQHFQSVVLYDFLKTVIDPHVYNDVMNNGPRFYKPDIAPDTIPAMPIEFAMAAFRFGHSMVRSGYPGWNRYQEPFLNSLFEQTYKFGGMRQLPSSWIASWDRLFDFREMDTRYRQPIMARRIDTKISTALSELPVAILPAQEPSSNLAVRTLLLGAEAGLPTGQSAATQINELMGSAHAGQIRILDEADILAGESDEVKQLLFENGMHNNTPLWFYILKEAQIYQYGDRLGELGSRIVMEVLFDIIKRSPDTILQETGKEWKSQLPCINPGEFGMRDLIQFAGKIDPYSM